MAVIILAMPAALLLTRQRPKITGLIALGFTVFGASRGGLVTNATTLLIECRQIPW
ncbi:MAG: hypothetical protein WBB22_08375 [Anaerolineae bacterium]